MGNLAVIDCKFENNCNEIRKMSPQRGKGGFTVSLLVAHDRLIPFWSNDVP